MNTLQRRITGDSASLPPPARVYAREIGQAPGMIATATKPRPDQ
jgi:hypothetical protein